ncbi:hypothetical protein MRX96_003877 [Rhipicephalus microplus]
MADEENSFLDSGRENTLLCKNEPPAPTYCWKDITKEFREATRELELGELVHDDSFTLFEAMSAIEMMDPKMDAGMMCNFGNKKVMNFDQAVSAGALKIADLSPAEHIGIIDSTLACLVTWLEGHSLAQTVFTNLYLHKPHQVEDKAAVFEEEDFQPVVYGFKLAWDVTEVRAAGMMKEIEDELSKKVKATRAKLGEELDSAQLACHEEAVAVYSRIKFCRFFQQALVVFNKKGSDGVEEVERLLQQCLEVLPVLRRTIALGVQPDPNAEGTNRADYPTSSARPWPCVLSRSVVQLLYLPCPGKVLGNLTYGGRPQGVNAFLNHCVRPFTSMVHISGHNRARQRDKLTHLLEELAVLQDEADRLDTVLHSISLKMESSLPHQPQQQLACFTTWVLHHVLRTMIRYLLSGFELELYSAHEYGYIYCREIVISQAYQNLCGGYYKTLAGFTLDGKLRRPCPEFDKEKVRYEHRFAPFNSILTPPPNARMLLDSLPDLSSELTSVMKVAKTNFVVVKLLLSGHKKDSTMLPEFDFSQHKNFPIIRI